MCNAYRNINRHSFLLGIDTNSIVLLRVGDYDKLLKYEDNYRKACKNHGLDVELVEVDRDEFELLQNDARELHNKFKYIMKEYDRSGVDDKQP